MGYAKLLLLEAVVIATAVASTVPSPPTAMDIATAVVGTAPMAANIGAAVAGALPAPVTPMAAETFCKASKQSAMDDKLLPKITQWMSSRQSMVATQWEHGVGEVFDLTYIPPDAAGRELFLEPKNFMFSVFSFTLKESSAVSLYDTYAIEGEANYSVTGFYPKFKNPSGLVLM